MIKTKKEAKTIVGGLSNPSKMPCYGYSIPANKCQTGMKMREKENSICADCYALKGMYSFHTTQAALERRYESLMDERWADAMTKLIKGMEHFRWHDSGDLQGLWHLKNIIKVCLATPGTQHWLPTREYKMVKEYIEGGGIIPDNLTIRFSALFFDGPAPEKMANLLGVQVSGASESAYSCPASQQDNACGDCRKCWDRTVFNVSYKKH